MEIRSVTNEIKNNYPKMNQMNKRDLRNSVPSTLGKIGLLSVMMQWMMNSKVFAKTSLVENGILRIGINDLGVIAGAEPIPVPVAGVQSKQIPFLTPIGSISLIGLIASIISICILNKKSKKGEVQQKNLFKALNIISAIILVIALFGFVVSIARYVM